MSAALKGHCSRPVLLLTGTPQPCVHSVTWLKTALDVTYGAKTRILKNMRASLSILAPLSVASLAPRWARSKAPSGLAAGPW